jgi:pyruvate ferredoxin oxidoreductase gamma subunit
VRPDAVIIQDVTLLGQGPLLDDVAPDAYVLINSALPFEDFLGLPGMADRDKNRCCCIPASDLALKHTGLALPNAALLGGFAALTGQFTEHAVCEAIQSKFPGGIGVANAAAAKAAFALLSREVQYVQAN